MSFAFPANTNQYLDGTPFSNQDMSNITTASISAMLGIEEQQSYLNRITQMRFGMHTPTHFSGYNSQIPWPFWSAPVLTYAFSLEALSKYQALPEYRHL